MVKFGLRGLFGGFACLVAVLLFVFSFLPLCFAVDFVEAVEAVERAEVDLGLAFVAVAESEAAGADVSGLLVRLNVAGGLLADAQSSLGVGDYSGAFVFAVGCSDAVEGVVGDAEVLRLGAQEAGGVRLFFAVFASVGGLVLLFVFGFLGWRLLKRWFFKRVLDMKPSVGVEQ